VGKKIERRASHPWTRAGRIDASGTTKGRGSSHFVNGKKDGMVGGQESSAKKGPKSPRKLVTSKSRDEGRMGIPGMGVADGGAPRIRR